MAAKASDTKMTVRLMFRLLPIQILLGGIGQINAIVSSLFASNVIGTAGMSAVGLYFPVSSLLGAIAVTLSGGAAVVCGKHMGRNQPEKMREIFALDLALSLSVGAVLTAALLVMGLFQFTGFLASDPLVRPLFDRYLVGMSIGVIPTLLGGQLAVFLSLENKTSRTTAASLTFIAVNVVLNYLFLPVLRLETLGLALAASLGQWVFFGVEAAWFLSKSSFLRFAEAKPAWSRAGELLHIGFPGAASNTYQALRALIVNRLLGSWVGSVGVSALAVCNNFLAVFWAIPLGMSVVARMLMSVSLGEEDRRTLTDVMRTALRCFIPIMCLVAAALIACAVPITRLFYRDAADPVYRMTVTGFRILPLCMPPGLLCMMFMYYGQVSGKQGMVHTLSFLDGVVFVAAFTAVLIPSLGMSSVYIANVLNGVGTTIFILGYAAVKCRHFPRNMDELMTIPEDFGVEADERMDLTVRSMEEVVHLAESVQSFCAERGLDARRSTLAALALEEMAGNVVAHGFTKDKKNHSADVLAAHKGGELILRIRDDCVPFDPAERLRLTPKDDPAANVGIRMVYGIAKNVEYQNILGLNVLTVRI